MINYMPQALREQIANTGQWERCQEIRLRAEKRAMLVCEREYILDYIPSQNEINSILSALSGHSLYAHSGELRQGFFTMKGGMRIGVAGRGVSEDGAVRLLKDYTSINIRIAHDVYGIHKYLFKYISKGGELKSTLIVSPPGKGKTTLLRDLVRAVSNGDMFSAKTCCVVDEREEISDGFDMGLRTDVLKGVPKVQGMYMALRTMGPQVIATDEIGSGEDLRVVRDIAGAGVKLIATAHAADLDELMQRTGFSCLAQVIDCVAVLSDRLGRSTLEQVYEKGAPLLQQPIRLEGEYA